MRASTAIPVQAPSDWWCLGALLNGFIRFVTGFEGRTYAFADDTAEAKGREHHPWAFSSWLAGAGVKPGIVHGATDEIGLRAVEKPVQGQ